MAEDRGFPSSAVYGKRIQINRIIYELQAVGAQAQDLVEMTEGVTETILAARELRRQKSGLLEDSQKSWIDNTAIARAEQVLHDVASLIVPATDAAQGVQPTDSRSVSKLSTIRDSPRIATLLSRLGIASNALNTAIVVLSGRSDDYMASMTRAPPRPQIQPSSSSQGPPAYAETSFLHRNRRQRWKEATDLTPSNTPELASISDSMVTERYPRRNDPDFFARQIAFNDSGTTSGLPLLQFLSPESPPIVSPQPLSDPDAAGLEVVDYSPYRPQSPQSHHSGRSELSAKAEPSPERKWSFSMPTTRRSMDSLSSAASAPAKVLGSAGGVSPQSDITRHATVAEGVGSGRTTSTQLQHSRSRGRAWLYKKSLAPS